MAQRPVALSFAGGGVGGLCLQAIFELLRDTSISVPPEPYLGPIIEPVEHWHWPSIVLGVLIGLSIGPLCELLLELRALWCLWFRRQLHLLLRIRPGPRAGPLYREL